ncbi:MAG: DUF4097 family beta strand repeat protein [Ardenticatenales bacterium]|nr:DUF4097 family beta strand repeat protein [Ardenticatenales bacterium]
MTTILNNLEVAERVTLELSGGDVVVKAAEGAARLIGKAKVEQREGETVIRAKDDVVLTLPGRVTLTLRGRTNDVALNGLGEVLLANGCGGDLSASHIRVLRSEGELTGDVALRQISEDVTLGQIYGDLVISHGAGITLAQVHGDITLRHVGSVQLNQVHSDLTITQAASVQIAMVSGDVRLDAIAGAIVVQQVDGDLIVHQPGSSLVAPAVAGDVRLAGTLKGNTEYLIKADGDVELRVDGNAHFTFRSVDGELHLGEGLEQEQGEDGTIHVYMGQREGAAQVTIEAGGDVSIDFLEREREHRRGHRKHWSGDFHFEGPGVRVHVDPEIRQAMEQAREEVKRAQYEVKEELKRAKQHIREEMKHAFRDADTHGMAGAAIGEIIRGSLGELLTALRPAPPAPQAPARPSAPPAPTPPSSEEIKLILSMVQEGKITPEEAEQLIRAME